jgi:hypothetical protein
MLDCLVIMVPARSKGSSIYNVEQGASSLNEEYASPSLLLATAYIRSHPPLDAWGMSIEGASGDLSRASCDSCPSSSSSESMLFLMQQKNDFYCNRAERLSPSFTTFSAAKNTSKASQFSKSIASSQLSSARPYGSPQRILYCSTPLFICRFNMD